jgi:SAM-dependent methyltransferase
MRDTDFYNLESTQYSHKRYPKVANSYLQFFFIRRLAITKEYVRRVAGERKNLSLLEVGCADGVITRALAAAFPQNFIKLCGIDIAPAMIEAARKFNSDPRVGFMLRDQYKGDPVDVVVETGVVNYGSFDEEIAFAAKHLKPGDHYILSVAGNNSVYARLKYDTGLKDFRPYRVYAELIDKEFEVVSETGVGLFIPYLWRIPALARPLQTFFDWLLGPLWPGLCHEKMYMLKRKYMRVLYLFTSYRGEAVKKFERASMRRTDFGGCLSSPSMA